MAEHKIYRSLDRGPLLWGLPVVQVGVILGSASLGFFCVKAACGMTGALIWLFLHGVAWAIMAFLTSQDPMYLPMLSLRLAAKFYPKLTCYTPVQKQITWIEKE